MESLSLQAQVLGVQEEDFTVDFPSILPGHPAFLYELAGLGNSHSPLNLFIQNISGLTLNSKSKTSKSVDLYQTLNKPKKLICLQPILSTFGLLQVEQLDSQFKI